MAASFRISLEAVYGMPYSLPWLHLPNRNAIRFQDVSHSLEAPESEIRPLQSQY